MRGLSAFSPTPDEEDKYSFTVDKLDEGFDIYEVTLH